MNIEEIMANLLKWARFEPYLRPNDLGEGLIWFIIPNAIRNGFSLLEHSRRFFSFLIQLGLFRVLIRSNSIFYWNYIILSSSTVSLSVFRKRVEIQIGVQPQALVPGIRISARRQPLAPGASHWSWRQWARSGAKVVLWSSDSFLINYLFWMIFSINIVSKTPFSWTDDQYSFTKNLQFSFLNHSFFLF